jgi:hypothetical protein
MARICCTKLRNHIKSRRNPATSIRRDKTGAGRFVIVREGRGQRLEGGAITRRDDGTTQAIDCGALFNMDGAAPNAAWPRPWAWW